MIATRVATGVTLKQITPRSPQKSPRQVGSKDRWAGAGVVVRAASGGTGGGAGTDSFMPVV